VFALSERCDAVLERRRRVHCVAKRLVNRMSSRPVLGPEVLDECLERVIVVVGHHARRS
jgi:hypothetical protein